MNVLAGVAVIPILLQVCCFLTVLGLTLAGSSVYRRMLDNLQHQARLLEEPLDRQELQEVLEETQQGVLRIQQIVTDLRGFSRAGELGEQERGRLEDAVQEARRLVSVRLREGGEVSVELAPGLPTVKLGQRHIPEAEPASC